MPYKTLSAYRRAHRKGEDSFDYKKSHNLLKDYEQYGRWKKVLGDKEMPETLAEFQEMKYNNNKKFELLHRQKNTINKLTKKEWAEAFKKKAIDTYYQFRQKNLEISDHGVARYLQRKFDFEQIVDICNKPFNYLQNDGKKVKCYDKIAVVYSDETKEIVTIINVKKPKGEWNEIKN